MTETGGNEADCPVCGYRNGQNFGHFCRAWRSAVGAPLLVSAEAEALREQLVRVYANAEVVGAERNEAWRLAEGLRAELAEAKAQAETYHGMSVRLNSQLSEALDDLFHAREESDGAALRAAGGQEKPSALLDMAYTTDEGGRLRYWRKDGTPWVKPAAAPVGGPEKPTLCPCGHPVHAADPCGAPIGEHQCACRQRPLAAAPVGGQAEPSGTHNDGYFDLELPADTRTAVRYVAAEMGYEVEIDEDRDEPLFMFRRAAAVSGEQATPEQSQFDAAVRDAERTDNYGPGEV